MNKAFPITSAQNIKLKKLIALRDKKTRQEEKSFLIEGYREITRAKMMDYPLEALFFCRELFLGTQENALIADIGKRAALYELPRHLFEKCSYRDRPDGLLAIAPIKNLTWEAFEIAYKTRATGEAPFLLLAESIEKPGNLGSILRSCDAAGVHGVLVCDPKVDVFNPNVVRASVGTLFTVPILECSLENALLFLKKEDIRLVAATPHAKPIFTQVDLSCGLAIAMGTEQLGLSEKIMKRADIQVKIPMLGVADSLNVAAATTLMLYEVVRQRKL